VEDLIEVIVEVPEVVVVRDVTRFTTVVRTSSGPI
jgi:hypothetical protein